MVANALIRGMVLRTAPYADWLIAGAVIEAVPRAKLMQDMNFLELALIDLEYAAADCSHRKTSTSVPSECVDLEALLHKIMTAKVAVKYALDTLRTPAYRDVARAA
jgi:hypothetical protein